MDPVEDGAGAATQPAATDAQVAQAQTLADPVDVSSGLPPELVGGGIVALVAILVAVVIALRRARVPPVLPGPTAAPQIEAPRPETAVQAPLPVEAPPEPIGLAARLRTALQRSRAVMQERFDQLFRGHVVDESLFEDLEVALISADVGVSTTARLIDRLRDLVRQGETDPAQLRAALKQGIRDLFVGLDPALLDPPAGDLRVILIVGVNGSGKTTTIGKLAARFHREGLKVMLSASDTFRAAASDQLEIWAERAGADIVSGEPGADPGAVAYDALQAAKARGCDVVIVDTAGRLQTRKPLMEQLSKIRRVIGKVVEGAPHETLLVLDGTIGQNALSQAQLFNEATPLTGVVVTKLDGTAKGGMVLTVAAELGLPVKLIGIGEKVDDLRPFESDAFVEALA